MDEPFPDLGKNQVNLSCVRLLPLLAYVEFLPTMLSYSSLHVLAFVVATPMGLPFPPALCLYPFQLHCKGRRPGQAAGEETQRALGSWSQGPWTLLSHALVTLSRCAATFLCMSVPTLQLGSYFSICSLHTLEPSQPNSLKIQLSQNTCKIPLSKIFQINMTLVKILFFFPTETSSYSFPALHNK